MRQPYHLDYQGSDPKLPQLVADADEMFRLLFSLLGSAGADVDLTAGTGITITEVDGTFTISLTTTPLTIAQVAARAVHGL